MPKSGTSSSTTESTMMSAVPTGMQCHNRPINADISSMKFAMVGASALPSGVRLYLRVPPVSASSRDTG